MFCFSLKDRRRLFSSSEKKNRQGLKEGTTRFLTLVLYSLPQFPLKQPLPALLCPERSIAQLNPCELQPSYPRLTWSPRFTAHRPLLVRGATRLPSVEHQPLPRTSFLEIPKHWSHGRRWSQVSQSFKFHHFDSVHNSKNQTWSPGTQDHAEPRGPCMVADELAFEVGPRGSCFVISQERQRFWSQPRGTQNIKITLRVRARSLGLSFGFKHF
jgi:hypothetical protein